MVWFAKVVNCWRERARASAHLCCVDRLVYPTEVCSLRSGYRKADRKGPEQVKFELPIGEETASKLLDFWQVLGSGFKLLHVMSGCDRKPCVPQQQS